jgi:hypothetical protein
MWEFVVETAEMMGKKEPTSTKLLKQAEIVETHLKKSVVRY